jgi:Xaa-Pro aminopeptidase
MIDFGVNFEGFMSDVSRTFYFLKPGEGQPPAQMRRLFEAHHAAIREALQAIEPGTEGWRVDEVARQPVREAGYPEFDHALGHQVGRLGHDGGTLLAPKWEAYGNMPYGPLLEGEVYTLEPTIITTDGLVCQREEEVLVTSRGPQVLTRQQTEIICIGD